MIEPPKLYTHDRLIFDIKEIESLASLIIDLALPIDFVLRESFERLVELAGTKAFLPSFSKIQETVLNLKHGRKRSLESGMIVPLASLKELTEWAKKSAVEKDADLSSHVSLSHSINTSGGLIGNMDMLSDEILGQDYHQVEMNSSSSKDSKIIDLSCHHHYSMDTFLSNTLSSSSLLMDDQEFFKTDDIMNRVIQPTNRKYVFKRIKKTHSGKFIPSL